MIKNLLWQLFFRNDFEFVLDKINLDEQLDKSIKDNKILQSEINEKDITAENFMRVIETLQNKNDTLSKEIVDLKSNIIKEIKLEEYWNNLRPKTLWLYPGRPSPTNVDMNVYVDPRIFFQYDRTIPKVNGNNDDEKALNALQYVHKYITYTSDPKEYWQFAYETWKRRKGDCEDGAILMANIMLMSGIPYWRIRINAGDVKGGGHAYVTYLREKDDTWYVMDWCYWYSESDNFKKTWKKAEKYFSIWGSWNAKYVYGELPRNKEDTDDARDTKNTDNKTR